MPESKCRFLITVASVILLIVLGTAPNFFFDEAYAVSNRQRNVQTGDQDTRKEIKVLDYASDALYGSANLSLRGSRFRIDSKPPGRMKNVKIQVTNEFPRSGGYEAVVTNKNSSRAIIQVAQQPSKENEFELRLFIKGGFAAGPGPIAFEVYAVAAARQKNLPSPEKSSNKGIPLSKPKNPCNVVIITIDSLRPDRLGCYGYKRPTSPNLDTFAGQSVLFRNAFSTSSFTPPAHASLFTSKYVGDHGVLTWNKLGDEQVTLAEVLKECGYRTAASVSISMLTEQNLGQGFDSQKEGIFKGSGIIQNAFEVVKSPVGQPFFLWLHFWDVHRPYGRQKDWTRRFNPKGREGAGDDEEHYNLCRKTSSREQNGVLVKLFSPDKESTRPKKSFLDKSELTGADLRFIADRYDAGIAYLDSLLGPLLAELSTPQRLNDTMIIITADHGENLLEHEECLFSHDPFLYSVVARIPLLIRYPKALAAGQGVDALVSLIDIAPTVMEVIGLPVPPSFAEGKSLVPLLRDKTALVRREVYMECWGQEELKAVRSMDQLILRDMRNGETAYYDLQKDPGEIEPGKKPGGRGGNGLFALLIGFMERKDAEKKAPKLDPEMEQRLRSLGYIR